MQPYPPVESPLVVHGDEASLLALTQLKADTAPLEMAAAGVIEGEGNKSTKGCEN